MSDGYATMRASRHVTGLMPYHPDYGTKLLCVGDNGVGLKTAKAVYENTMARFEVLAALSAGKLSFYKQFPCTLQVDKIPVVSRNG